ncbi:hypothetical protein SAMN05660226_00560 [Parapedobacter luteus]|uniref:Lipoprotein n=1 Tax=Parapedobacter luteus TaxID=623280 RepID=A0A1T5A4E2_9SPHI|nr:hypothetical protein [Parapedobacter luteus]SKB29669.1 hypothetical protein SAMN05660226_00560 [Parapedobacter luteus]
MDTSKRILLALVILAVAGCSKKEVIPEHPVEVQFQLLNTTGEPTTSFREGEDIIFDYKIVNTSSQEVVWMYYKTDYTNLFEVSQVSAAQETKVIGSPYQNMVIRWLWVRPGHNMEPNDEVTMRMTWMGDWDRSIYFNTVLDGKHDLEGEETLHYSFFEYLHHPPPTKRAISGHGETGSGI